MVKKINEIIWTDPAKADLRRIFNYYIQIANPSIAEKIIISILDDTELLLNFPEAGPREELLKDKPSVYRFIVSGNYKVIYKVVESSVVIITVFDCRQNPVKMMNI